MLERTGCDALQAPGRTGIGLSVYAAAGENGEFRILPGFDTVARHLSFQPPS